jgi:hypothetical protein
MQLTEREGQYRQLKPRARKIRFTAPFPALLLFPLYLVRVI